jgi:hypothetical protein
MHMMVERVGQCRLQHVQAAVRGQQEDLAAVQDLPALGLADP